MTKYILPKAKISLLFTFLTISFFGLVQNINIIDSNVLQNYEDINFQTFKTSTHLYVVQDKYDMNVPMNRNVQVDVYNNKFKNVGSSLIDDKTLSGEEANIFEGFHIVGDKLYLFKSNYKNDKSEFALMYYPVSTKGEKGQGTELTSFPSEKAMNAGNFTLNVSPDGSKLVVFIEMPFERKANERCIVKVYDKDLTELWQKEYEFPYESVRGPKNDLFVNNDGNVHVLKTPDVKKQLDFHTVFTFLDKGNNVVESLYDMSPDLVMSSYESNFTEDGYLILTGLYYNDKKFGVNVSTPKGVFYLKLNGKNGKIDFQKSEEIDGNLANLATYSANLVNGEDIVLTAEVKSEDRDAVNPGSTPVEYIYNYKTERVMLFYITSEGSIKWQESISRDAKSRNDGGKTNNTYTWVDENEAHVLFRDQEYKHDGSDPKVVGPGRINTYVPVIASFNFETGEYSTKIIEHNRIGGRSAKLQLIPTTGYKIDANSCFMIAAELNSRRKLLSTRVSL